MEGRARRSPSSFFVRRSFATPTGVFLAWLFVDASGTFPLVRIVRPPQPCSVPPTQRDVSPRTCSLRQPALRRASRGEEPNPWRVGEWGGFGSFLVTRAALQRSRVGGPGRARASPLNTRNWHSSRQWGFGQVFADRLRRPISVIDSLRCRWGSARTCVLIRRRRTRLLLLCLISRDGLFFLSCFVSLVLVLVTCLGQLVRRTSAYLVHGRSLVACTGPQVPFVPFPRVIPRPSVARCTYNACLEIMRVRCLPV